MLGVRRSRRDRDDVAIICRNTTEAINHLAYRLRLGPDDVVVTTVVEHHANLLPWARLARRRYVECAADGTFGGAGRRGRARRRTAACAAGDHRRLQRHRLAPADRRDHRRRPRARRPRARRRRPARRPPPAARRRRLPRLERPQDVRTVRGGGADRAPDGVHRRRPVPRRWRRRRPGRPRRGHLDRPARAGGGRLTERHRVPSPCTRPSTSCTAIGWDAIGRTTTTWPGASARGSAAIDGVRLLGVAAQAGTLPVATFVVDGMSHALVAARLSAEHAIGVRHGCFCAHPYLLRLLGLDRPGGRGVPRGRASAATAAGSPERSGPAPGCPPRPPTSTASSTRSRPSSAAGRHRCPTTRTSTPATSGPAPPIRHGRARAAASVPPAPEADPRSAPPVPGRRPTYADPVPDHDGAPAPTARRRVDIVPHTHWDREWYSPFQTFRLRLVDLLDELLPQLEADPSYAHFLLDGQMAVVDDYLEVRPEAEERLRALATTGRVAMGPWYVLPDEFLVSGETLVRNLQLGLRVAARFGGAMDVGYLPDMFGHVAQMPQLLRLLRLRARRRVAGRALGDRPQRLLVGGARRLDACGPSTCRRATATARSCPTTPRPSCAASPSSRRSRATCSTGPILWMNGTDHLMPQPWLGRVVAEANALRRRRAATSCTSARWPSTCRRTDRGPAVVDGRAALGGPGQPAHGRGLEPGRREAGRRRGRARARAPGRAAVRAVPPADRWPGALLDEAWLEVIRNSAHDSICACSVDEVCDAVLHRFAEATQIADGPRRPGRGGPRRHRPRRRARARDREPVPAPAAAASSSCACPAPTCPPGASSCRSVRRTGSSWTTPPSTSPPSP